MQQCPRCKSKLVKSRSEKIVCRVCGYITKTLEVAANNQDFQEHHKFSTKISIKQAKSKRGDSDQNKTHYLISFTNMLRQAARHLCKRHGGLAGLESKVREIWLQYLKRVEMREVKIVGLFQKLNKKMKQKKTEDEIERENKQEEGDENEEGPKDEEGQQQEEKKEEAKVMVEPVVSKKRSRVKQESFNMLIKRKLIQISKLDPLECSKDQAFIQFIMAQGGGDYQGDSIEYASLKYVEILVKLMRQGKTSATRVAVKETLKLLEDRRDYFGSHLMKLLTDTKGRFGKKNLASKMILLIDLLREWGSRTGVKEETFQQLMVLYDGLQQEEKNPIISDLLREFTNQLKEQLDSIKKPQQSGQAVVPQLSFTLVYALINCSCLLLGHTFSIDQIVRDCGLLCLSYQSLKVFPDERISNYKIRKTTSLLYRLLDYSACISIKQTLMKWVAKYCRIYGIEEQTKAITTLCTVLHDSHLQKTANKVRSSRFDILEQDIIAKASILIYVKLQLGFDETPFLLVFPNQLLAHANLSKDNRVFLEGMQAKREPIINILSVLYRINENERETSFQTLKCYPANSYAPLSGLNTRELLRYVQECPYSQGNMRISGQTARTRPQLVSSPASIQKHEQTLRGLSQEMLKELKLAKKAHSRGRQYLNELDQPTLNYEFFHDYQSNIRHAGRQLFAYFCDSVAGECHPSEVFEWLEDLERVMIDFQN